MGPLETALLRTATTVVTRAGTWWLGRRRGQREREKPLIELLGTGVADDMGRKSAGRRVDDIVEAVYRRLEPLVRRRDGGPPDNEIAAALAAVTDTLEAADLSDTALFADDLDPVLMAARLRRDLPDIRAQAGLNEAAVQLYRQLLNESCVCMTQLVIQLGPFQGRAAAHTLERLTTVAAGIAQVLDRVPMRSLEAPAGDHHDNEFRNRYLSHVSQKLDVLELFGVDAHRDRLRTKLSIAYISLSVTGSNARGSRRGARFLDPGRFRHDSTGGNASVRAEQALGSAERILLRGDAGSGKTTLLQWIVVTAVRQRFTGDLESWNGRTPFLIRLRDHVRQPLPRPEEFLDKIAGTIAGQAPALWVHRQLKSGAILLVDGVDEVPEGRRREVRVWLQGLLIEYPDLRVVVTSRPAAAADRWLRAEAFVPISLERMSPADIKALIRHWHDAVSRADDLLCEPHRVPGFEQRLLAQLEGSAHLQNLAGSPLLCAMLCALNLHRDSNLPRNRMDIYQAAVDMLLYRRDDKRGVHNPIPELAAGDQLQLLQEIAWWLTENGQTELSREQAEKRVEQRLARIRHITAPTGTVLEHMVQRSGILREPVPDRIDFVHRTFQEYLAAREAAYQGRAGALLARAHLDTWHETIILAAGHAHAPVCEALLAGLLDLADQQPHHARKLRLLAAACLGTAAAVEPGTLARIRAHLRGIMPRNLAEARSFAAVGEPLLAELPDEVSGLTEARAAAIIQAAAIVNGPQALQVLARYATDPRGRVQRQLITAWDFFDPVDYAEQVLADAPLDDGSVRINNPALLPALSRLRHLRRVDVSASGEVDLALLDDVPHLTMLHSMHGFTGRLDVLARHGGTLRSLGLNLRRQDHDLSVLQDLPGLEVLSLVLPAADQDLSSLRLPQLTNLGLTGIAAVPDNVLAGHPRLAQLLIEPTTAWDPTILRRLPGLTGLSLNGSAEPIGGVGRFARELASLRKLDSLFVAGCEWLTDLNALAHLGTLEWLSIDYAPVDDLRPLARLTGLQWLSIDNDKRLFDLAPLADLPNLRTLYIGAEVRRLDLSPLKGSRVVVHFPRSIRRQDVAVPPGLRVKRY